MGLVCGSPKRVDVELSCTARPIDAIRALGRAVAHGELTDTCYAVAQSPRTHFRTLRVDGKSVKLAVPMNVEAFEVSPVRAIGTIYITVDGRRSRWTLSFNRRDVDFEMGLGGKVSREELAPGTLANFSLEYPAARFRLQREGLSVADKPVVSELVVGIKFMVIFTLASNPLPILLDSSLGKRGCIVASVNVQAGRNVAYTIEEMVGQPLEEAIRYLEKRCFEALLIPTKWEVIHGWTAKHHRGRGLRWRSVDVAAGSEAEDRPTPRATWR